MSDSIDNEAVLRQLQRILASPSFARSQRLTRFLRLSVEETLAGRAGLLKEYHIGVEVFDRGADFDPRVDTIVRTQAHRLRAMLSAYYENEGAEDPVIVEIPKGSYVPVYHWRDAAGTGTTAGATAVAEVTPVHRGADGRRLPLLVQIGGMAGAAILAAVLTWVFLGRRTDTQMRPVHTAILIGNEPEIRLDRGVGALSPDGDRLVFSGMDNSGVRRLWLRSLEGDSVQALPGTDGGVHPFWSPDGRAVGFFADLKLKTIRLPNGPVQTLSEAPASRGGAWGRRDQIVFAAQSTGPLVTVTASGGPATPATTLDAGSNQNLHRWPWFLPDGETFIYFARSTRPGESGFFATGPGSDKPVLLFRQELISNIAYVARPGGRDGHLLYVHQGRLLARPFNPESLSVTGAPQILASGVSFPSTAVAFSAVTDRLIYLRAESSTVRIAWVDENGAEVAAVGAPGDYSGLEISPDGRRVAFERRDETYGTADIWVMDLPHGAPSRLTSDASNDMTPIWRPNGSALAFTSERTGLPKLWVKSLDAQGAERPVLETTHSQFVYDWSRDGETILFGEDHEITQFDLWSVRSGGRPELIFSSPHNERQARYSPNGALIAYVSDASGRDEVYVRPTRSTDSAGPGWRVSTDGGEHPRWAPGGQRLFYVAPDGLLMSASITGLGARLEVSRPERLFRIPMWDRSSRANYAVSSNARRFLVTIPVASSAPAAIPLLLNWSARLSP